MAHIVPRTPPGHIVDRLMHRGIHPLLARLYAARGIGHASELEYALSSLLNPSLLRGAEDAARFLAESIQARKRLLIIADYDCDGATACAVGVRALRSLGADVGYLVPNRFEYGYGLTPEIVELAKASRPDVLVTVDNGIASVEGVAAARAAGFATVITDHHLPGDTLPDADCIVNPNQPGCDFPSKNLAGVGVMFYVMLALRSELRQRGFFADRPEPRMADLLDLVALGTVADVVRLDHNNRILVSQGLSRMRQGKMQPGLRALFRVAGRDADTASTFDLGFALGPRLNAAGRLSDMSLGIECLITDDFARAFSIAQQLDTLNRERRSIESEMKEQAAVLIDGIGAGDCSCISLFDPGWHQGVVGILASRVKDKLHRPVFAFAPGNNGDLRGSGRSIPGLHLRDALDLLSKRDPELLLRFGGHAAAAGVTIRDTNFRRFEEGMDAIVRELTSPELLMRRVETDGSLETAYMSIPAAEMLEGEIWGQGFPAPVFSDIFQVERQRILKDKHLKLVLRKGNAHMEAIQFNNIECPGNKVHAAFRLGLNDFNGVRSVQLVIEHLLAE